MKNGREKTKERQIACFFFHSSTSYSVESNPSRLLEEPIPRLLLPFFFFHYHNLIQKEDFCCKMLIFTVEHENRHVDKPSFEILTSESDQALDVWKAARQPANDR